MKDWKYFFVVLGIIFFNGQVLNAKANAEELNAEIREILANPEKKMKPSLQQELRRVWKKAAMSVFREFLPGLEDKFSFRVRTVKINNKPAIYFLATGEKRSPDVTPVAHLILEVFINSGGDTLLKKRDHETWDMNTGNDKFRMGGFVADRAVLSAGMGEKLERYFWQKGEHYVEVHSQGDVKTIAQKIQLKLQSLGFYDFPAFLLKNGNNKPAFVVAGVLPSQEADLSTDHSLNRATEGESGEWVFKGCYKDASSKKIVRRDVFGFITNESDMTNEKCMRHCRVQNYPVAATQFGNWCFCGSDFGSFGEADNCNMGCAGNPKEVCGGRWANSVYKLAPRISPEPNDVP